MKTKKALAVGLLITAALGGGCAMTPTKGIDRVKVDPEHPETLGTRKVEAFRDIGVARENSRAAFIHAWEAFWAPACYPPAGYYGGAYGTSYYYGR